MNNMCKVTVIDDCEADSFLIEEMLTKAKFDVKLVRPYRKLMHSLESDNSDMVLIDMHMGLLNGFDVFNQLDESKKPKVYFMSGAVGGHKDIIMESIKGMDVGYIDKNNLEEDLKCLQI